jgi:hypothetical protein
VIDEVDEQLEVTSAHVPIVLAVYGENRTPTEDHASGAPCLSKRVKSSSGRGDLRSHHGSNLGGASKVSGALRSYPDPRQ